MPVTHKPHSLFTMKRLKRLACVCFLFKRLVWRKRGFVNCRFLKCANKKEVIAWTQTSNIKERKLRLSQQHGTLKRVPGQSGKDRCRYIAPIAIMFIAYIFQKPLSSCYIQWEHVIGIGLVSTDSQQEHHICEALRNPYEIPKSFQAWDSPSSLVVSIRPLGAQTLLRMASSGTSAEERPRRNSAAFGNQPT